MSEDKQVFQGLHHPRCSSPVDPASSEPYTLLGWFLGAQRWSLHRLDWYFMLGS